MKEGKYLVGGRSTCRKERRSRGRVNEERLEGGRKEEITE